ncbi:hypothetical protein DM02DRAFT_723774 [Periconia macrospinosa]|uniref:Uncharacterized protein n=1 Tax=Periconia macrospinosa TaxID=97972 RepID=A0A2V1ED84_9PLEO|nr:hypothetical protein DM02DRAFT_723774 [Periconia macrospinosa]
MRHNHAPPKAKKIVRIRYPEVPGALKKARKCHHTCQRNNRHALMTVFKTPTRMHIEEKRRKKNHIEYIHIFSNPVTFA